MKLVTVIVLSLVLCGGAGFSRADVKKSSAKGQSVRDAAVINIEKSSSATVPLNAVILRTIYPDMCNEVFANSGTNAVYQRYLGSGGSIVTDALEDRWISGVSVINRIKKEDVLKVLACIKIMELIGNDIEGAVLQSTGKRMRDLENAIREAKSVIEFTETATLDAALLRHDGTTLYKFADGRTLEVSLDNKVRLLRGGFVSYDDTHLNGKVIEIRTSANGTIAAVVQ